MMGLLKIQIQNYRTQRAQKLRKRRKKYQNFFFAAFASGCLMDSTLGLGTAFAIERF
jgi:hypothetical protein